MPFYQSQPPIRPDVGVVAYVPDNWDWKWQPRHQVLARLSRYFRVVWVSPAFDWQEALGLHPLRNLPPSPPLAGPGFEVMSPSRWLPKFYGPAWLTRSAERLRWHHACSMLRRRGCKTIIAYLWRPEFASVLGFGGFQLSCYHVDDEYSFSDKEQPISDQERHILERAGQVFIHSPMLFKKKGSFNPRTLHVPNGVDFASFSTPVPEPSDIAGIPHPRIGYAGWLKPQLDWELLCYLADRHPDWQFVFVGALNPRADAVKAALNLQTRRNVHLLGSKETPELAKYPQFFDVSIMPYRLDDYTKFIYPLKVHEYLAAGRPVVGTRLPSLEPFADVVALPGSPEQWGAEIAASLLSSAETAERRQARQKVADAHDWDALVARIASAMAQGLGLQSFKDFGSPASERNATPQVGKVQPYATVEPQ